MANNINFGDNNNNGQQFKCLMLKKMRNKIRNGRRKRKYMGWMFFLLLMQKSRKIVLRKELYIYTFWEALWIAKIIGGFQIKVTWTNCLKKFGKIFGINKAIMHYIAF